MGLPQIFLTTFWLYRTLKVRESSLTAAFTRCVQFPATLTSARSRTWSWPSRPSPKRASSGSWSRFRRSSHSTFVVMTRLKKSPLQEEARTKLIKLSYLCHFPEEEIVNLNGRKIFVKRRIFIFCQDFDSCDFLLLSYFLRGAISVSLQPFFKLSLFLTSDFDLKKCSSRAVWSEWGAFTNRWKYSSRMKSCFVLFFICKLFPKQNEASFIQDQLCHLADDGSPISDYLSRGASSLKQLY